MVVPDKQRAYWSAGNLYLCSSYRTLQVNIEGDIRQIVFFGF
jgi:hypothetical protein